MPSGSRKFLITLAALLAGSVLAFLGKLDGPTATFLGGLVAAYCSANVVSKRVAA